MDRLISSEKYAKSVNNSLEKAAKFIDRNKNFITSISKSPLYNDEPKIFAYTGAYKSRHKQNNDAAGGFSFNKKVALMRVLGEGLERYCLEKYNPKIVFMGSEQDIKIDYLDPRNICAFSKRQLGKSNFKKFRIDNKPFFRWTKGFSLNRKKNLLIPAQLVSFNYVPMKNEPTIRFPISTGTAAGSSLNDALYRGICEIVERDSFMISYLNKLPSPQVNLVGKKASHMAWLLIQHADSDVKFQKYCLELMKKVAKENEVSKVDIAYLIDRILINKGKPQLYGTQFYESKGKLIPRPIKDADKLNEIRKKMGLEPFEEYEKTILNDHKNYLIRHQNS